MGTVVTAARRALGDVPVNVGFVRAVLDGTADGELWCDDETDPRAFHAVHPYGMSLVWGDGVPDVFPAVVDRIRTRAATGRQEWLQVEPRWADLGWDAALGAEPFGTPDAAHSPAARHTRVNFAFAPPAPSVAPPEGWRSRAAVAADVALTGSVVPSLFWPDAEAFLAHGGGVVLERDSRVGAIAFTSYRWDDQVEIGIETVPEARRQGLGAAVAAAMVERVVDAGLVPVWSCREDNVGSARLAARVGFVPTLHLPYWHVRAARP